MTNATVVLLLLLMGIPIFAQDADSDMLRKLTAATPQISVIRREIKASPALTFEGISAIAADKRGNLYIIHRPADGDPIVVLDSKGKILRSWGKGMFKIPHGIRLDPDGNVWTVDANTSIVYKFTPYGKKLLEISVGGVPDPTNEFCGATDVAFGRNGHIFVADGYCNARVIEYDSHGRRVREWGKPGTGPGEFNVVHAIVIGPHGNLYIADRENGRVQWFDTRGKFLGQWKFGGQLYNVAFTRGGDMYVSTHPKGISLDTEFNVVKIDPDNGRMLGRFEVRSHELAVGSDGTLLPATRSGQLLLFHTQ